MRPRLVRTTAVHISPEPSSVDESTLAREVTATATGAMEHDSHSNDATSSTVRPRRVARFIALRNETIRRIVERDTSLTPEERRQFAELARLLDATIHHAYHERLERLKGNYAYCDPELESGVVANESDPHAARADERFLKEMSRLLDHANFEHLTFDHLAEALDAASELGFHLDVDFRIFKRLEIFGRGERSTTVTICNWWEAWRKRTITIPVYERLVVMFQLHEGARHGLRHHDRHVYLKLFKDVPKSDLDMLLPGTRIRMTWLDQGKILFPTLSGVAITLYKIIHGALALAFLGFYSAVFLICGAFGYGLKSLYSYWSTRDKYYLNLARQLYYQSLDSNAGVIFHLLNEAEEQDFREAFLAYYLLWKRRDHAVNSVVEIDRAAEAFIREHTGVEVDFDVSDAIEKLAHMKLVRATTGSAWQAVDLSQALARLDQHWDALFHEPTPPTNAI